MQFPKWGWYAIAAFAIYWFFLRRNVVGSGLATGTITVGTGANSTQFPGFPQGYAPVGAQQMPGAMYGPGTPAMSSQASTGVLLGGIGQLIGGIGSAASGVLGALGASGVFGGGVNTGSSGGSYSSGSYSSGFDGSDPYGGSSMFDFDL
jgi:hypothetical protein